MATETTTILQSLCKERGWDAHDLASYLTVAGHRTSAISTRNWLRGDFTPSMEKAQALAELFGISLDELFPASTATAAKD